ncbi:peroxidase 43-like [Wolffia australiana]
MFVDLTGNMTRLTVLSVIVLLSLLHSCRGQLKIGFYKNRCPVAEDVVRSAVARAFASEPDVAPQLLRLHFHDCIVDGCDGSILINLPDGQQENKAFGHQGLRGFNVIDEAKAQLESQCPGVVSCADIVALAARDSVVLTKGLFYKVETGRLDGFSSSISHASNLPGEDEPIRALQNKFSAKGLSSKDLVLLSAAHTIGTTACFFMGVRLNNFQGTGRPDPSIAPPFLAKLQGICPSGGDVNVRLAMDDGSENAFDTRNFDNILARTAVLQSDAALLNHPTTRAFVEFYARSPDAFRKDFGISMVKLGRLGVLTGANGNIRKVCSMFN